LEGRPIHTPLAGRHIQLADAVPPSGGIPPFDPGGDASNVLQLLEPILFLGAIVVGVVVVGLAVARIGSRARAAEVAAADAGGAGDDVADQPSTQAGLLRLAVLGLPLIAAAGLGLIFGRQAAYNRSLGGLEGVFAYVTLIVEVGGLVLLALGVATVAWLSRGRRGSTAIRTLLLTAGALVVGAVAGQLTAPVTGGEYVAPVILRAGGQGTLALDGTTPAFVGATNSQVQCESVPDGRSLQSVLGLAFGELGTGTVRGTVSGTGSSWTVELYIDGGDVPEGAEQPFWNGPAVVDGVVPDGTTGRVTFTDLQPEAGKGAVASAPAGWPATLSGSLRWSCQPWS
jgi:hypothetical protein